MACPGNPPTPAGWTVWRGTVPPTLVQWAHELLYKQSGDKPFGFTWTTEFAGASVLARKEHHTYTIKPDGRVVPGCYTGITLYKPANPNAPKPQLVQPDVDAAHFDLDITDWTAVAASGAVLALIVGGFFLALRYAGKR